MQAEDAWLCSASLRLLSGEVSEALAPKLGWQAPLSVSALGTQLVELGKMHPEAGIFCHAQCFPDNSSQFLSSCATSRRLCKHERRVCECFLKGTVPMNIRVCHSL